MRHLTFTPLLGNASEAELQNFQVLFESTFVETFGANYSSEDLQSYCQERLSLQQLKAELAEPHNYFYSVQVDKQPVGYCKWTVPCTRYLDPSLVQRYKKPFFLERFYFYKSAQGSGVAAVAMQFALSHAKAVHLADFIYLSVWEHNHRAQHFYQNFGFRTIGAIRYIVGATEDHEYLYGRKV